MRAGGVIALAAAPANAYLIALLVAAARAVPPAGSGAVAPAAGMRFAVLIPARDEEAGIAAAVGGVRALGGDAEPIVIADNCRDGTEAAARAAGATVWPRRGDAEGGKGGALAWAFERVVRERPAVDAVLVLDADCVPSPNALGAIAARLRDGAGAVQLSYAVANPESSWVAALRFASFALINHVRPLGKDALGLSAGLLGTGMAFRAELLARCPWEARSLIEDQEQHLRLVAAGERVAFAPEASVRSAMPTTLRRARSQQLRWDAGRAGLIRAYAPRLLRLGVRRRDPAQLHAAVEPLVPPQSLLLAANALGFLLALRARPALRRLACANAAAQIGYVAGGLSLVHAPAAVWRALALAPALAVWKLGLLARLWLGQAPTSWVRTERERAS